MQHDLRGSRGRRLLDLNASILATPSSSSTPLQQLAADARVTSPSSSRGRPWRSGASGARAGWPRSPSLVSSIRPSLSGVEPARRGTALLAVRDEVPRPTGGPRGRASWRRRQRLVQRDRHDRLSRAARACRPRGSRRSAGSTRTPSSVTLLPVDLDAPGRDEVLGRAARAEARLREHLLQAHAVLDVHVPGRLRGLRGPTARRVRLGAALGGAAPTEVPALPAALLAALASGPVAGLAARTGGAAGLLSVTGLAAAPAAALVAHDSSLGTSGKTWGKGAMELVCARPRAGLGVQPVETVDHVEVRQVRRQRGQLVERREVHPLQEVSRGSEQNRTELGS